jgi:hypothetical protein
MRVRKVKLLSSTKLQAVQAFALIYSMLLEIASQLSQFFEIHLQSFQITAIVNQKSA